MGEKLCSKCGEMVDDAKAFCPGCGNPIVEEKKRTSVSEFDQLDHTVRLGDTMYNQLLSDMGLTAPKQRNVGAKVIEPVEVSPKTPESFPGAGPSFAMVAVVVFAVLTAIALVIAFLYSL
jgi:hypothetical protein